jgi:5-methylcytosine-specific restriction protein A
VRLDQLANQPDNQHHKDHDDQGAFDIHDPHLPMTEAVYNGAWPRVRREVLKRDDYRCQIAGPNCKGKATEVDHIVPWDEGGARLDPRNLRSVCRPCHNSRKRRRLVVVKPEQAIPSREW